MNRMSNTGKFVPPRFLQSDFQNCFLIAVNAPSVSYCSPQASTAPATLEPGEMLSILLNQAAGRFVSALLAVGAADLRRYKGSDTTLNREFKQLIASGLDYFKDRINDDLNAQLKPILP